MQSASQYPLEAPRVGASVTVLTGDELRAKGVPTLADALRTVPGVAVTQSGTRGSLTEVRIRGGETNQVLVLIDGIEVNGLADSVFNFADFPVDDIERIEVIRGPQSGLFGSNANTGVISIITRSGKGLAKPVFEKKYEVGTQRTMSGYANARGALGPVYASLTLGSYSTRGYNVSRFGTEPDGSRAFTLTGKVGADITDQLNVEGVVRYTSRNALGDPQDFTFGSPTFGFLIDGNDATRYESLASRLGATMKLLDGHWIQSVNVRHFSEHTRGLTNGLVTFGADGIRNALDYKSTFLFDTAVLGGEKHIVTFYADHKEENYLVLFNTVPYIKRRTGIAGEYVIDLATHTTISTALRQDYNSAFADITTWRLALSQRFPAWHSRLHASHGKGVTDPSVFELFGSAFNLPNPSLLPEQSIGWDVGIEHTWFDGRFVTDVTYFQSEFTNKIELTFDAVRGGFIYLNGIGAAKRRGVEVAGTWRIFDWLTAAATYTYTEARDSLGLPEVRRPPHAMSFEATAWFHDRKGRLTVGVIHNGTRKDFIFTPMGALRGDLPGATVVRGLLSYDVAPWANVFVRAENIFDKRYEEVFSYRAPGFAIYTGIKLKTTE